jgi:hypothetical protein
MSFRRWTESVPPVGFCPILQSVSRVLLGAKSNTHVTVYIRWGLLPWESSQFSKTSSKPPGPVGSIPSISIFTGTTAIPRGLHDCTALMYANSSHKIAGLSRIQSRSSLQTLVKHSSVLDSPSVFPQVRAISGPPSYGTFGCKFSRVNCRRKE